MELTCIFQGYFLTLSPALLVPHGSNYFSFILFEFLSSICT